jgi:hypothetical protein
MYGKINLVCPICGKPFEYGGQRLIFWHHKTFGIIDTKACFDEAERKYAMLILGKDETLLERRAD